MVRKNQSGQSRDALDAFIDTLPAVTGFDPDIYRLLGRRLAALREASDTVVFDVTGAQSAAVEDDIPTSVRGKAALLAVLPLSRPAFRLSPLEPPDATPGKPSAALLRRRQPRRPEDPAQYRLPFDAQ